MPRVVLAALLAVGACAPASPEPPTAVAGVAVARAGPGLARQPAEASPTHVLTPVDPAELLPAALGPLIDGPDRVGLVIEHVASGARFEHAASEPAPAASVYKLFVAHEVLDHVDRGELNLDDVLTIEAVDTLEQGWERVGDRLTVAQALESMMGDSSNRAAFALLRLVGRARLNARLVELGLGRSSVPLLRGQSPLPGSPPLDEQYAMSSPADLARLLRMVATERTLTPASRAELRRLLALEETVEPLRSALPPEAVLAKNGWLPGVRTVAALVETPTGPVVLAAFVDAETDAAAEARLEQIGRAIAPLG